MLDVLASVRAYLSDQASLLPYTGPAGLRIFAGPDLPALEPAYKPADGPAILFNLRGGGQDYTSLVLNPSLQFRCYALTQALAIATDRALYDVLNDAQCYPIKMARLEVPGQPLAEPDTKWPFVLSFYRVDLCNV